MYKNVCSTLLSSVHEMDCLREETVSVSGRSGAQSSVASTRQYQLILPAPLLTLDEYSSWRLFGLGSAVQTTLRSLLRSDLVAELNHDRY